LSNACLCKGHGDFSGGSPRVLKELKVSEVRDGPGAKYGGPYAYLSKLRRDSVGADFQSVRKLTNYVCAAPLESRLSVRLLRNPTFSMIFPILAVELLNHNGLKYYQKFIN